MQELRLQLLATRLLRAFSSISFVLLVLSHLRYINNLIGRLLLIGSGRSAKSASLLYP